ncbi:MAG: DUF819 domain-containing protein [Ekhidna sp.]
MIYSPIYIIAFLLFLIFISEWLCKHTFLKHISSSLLVIILGAIVANLGWIPSASNASPLYGVIFQYVAPASIFFLLLGVNLKELRKAGIPMLTAFVLGSLGTIIGVVVALQCINYTEVFGANYAAIAGMLTGTYTGGSANFNAVALHYDVVKDGAIYTGVVVADNIITAIWMVVTLSIPALMNKLRPTNRVTSESDAKEITDEKEAVNPMHLSLILFFGVAAIMLSDYLAEFATTIGLNVPSILILTTIALVMAQIKTVQQISGARLLGMFSIYLFLAVVGAFCEISALIDVGAHAFDILLFTSMIVLIHGLFIIGCGWLMKSDWSIIAIASQANIGGASTALALAKSFKRNDLLLPAILAGSLGSGLGTYLGFLIAGIL